MRKKLMIGLLGVLLLALTACTADVTPQPAYLDPKVQLTMGADGRTIVKVGVCNVGIEDFAGDVCFAGQVNLYDEDGYLMEAAELEQLGPVSAHETVFPLEIKTALPQGDYRLAFSTQSYGYAVADFAIVERDGTQCLQASPQLICPQTDYTILTSN